MVEHAWGFPVALDLFFAGLAAGAFCFSVVAGRRKGREFEAHARAGAYLAPIALVLGLSMLVIDLMNKPRFWLTLTVLNTDSPMSLGVWLLTVFALITVLYALCWLPDAVRNRVPIIRTLTSPGNVYRGFVGLVGIPFALAVSVYTGVLLAAASHPLWRNPALPLLFCFSAMATGFSGGALVARRLDRKEKSEKTDRWLTSMYRIVLPLYLLVALIFIALPFGGGRPGVGLVLFTGLYGVLWWCGAFGIGIVLPLVLVVRKSPMKPVGMSTVLYSLLAGGLLMRLILVYAGQVETGTVLYGLLQTFL
jgi:polysulfide reductase chain C